MDGTGGANITRDRKPRRSMLYIHIEIFRCSWGTLLSVWFKWARSYWIFQNPSLALRSDSAYIYISSSLYLFIPLAIYLNPERLSHLIHFSFFSPSSIPLPLFLFSISLSPAMFRRTIETNRLIRSNVRRPRRLSLKDTIGLFSSPLPWLFFLFSPFAIHRTGCEPAGLLGVSSMGWKSRIRKSESRRPARLFVLSDWPSNTLSLEYFKDWGRPPF